MVGLKNGHIRKSLTKNGEPQRYSWGTKKKMLWFLQDKVPTWQLTCYQILTEHFLSFFGNSSQTWRNPCGDRGSVSDGIIRNKPILLHLTFSSENNRTIAWQWRSFGIKQWVELWSHLLNSKVSLYCSKTRHIQSKRSRLRLRQASLRMSRLKQWSKCDVGFR